MAKLIYSATMSLDGFIAGPGGDMSWASELLMDIDPVATDRLLHGSGALLVGANSYRGDDPNKGTDAEGAFGGQYHGPVVVLTHHIPAEPDPGVTFAGDLHEAVTEAQKAAGDAEYVNIIGADVARQCLLEGLLDEIVMFVAPVLLGDGVRVFTHEGGRNVALEPLTDLHPTWYRVVRN